MKYIKRFKVCICPECGKVQITEAKKLKCVRCGKVREFRKNGMWHVKLWDYDTMEESYNKYLELTNKQ